MTGRKIPHKNSRNPAMPVTMEAAVTIYIKKIGKMKIPPINEPIAIAPAKIAG